MIAAAPSALWKDAMTPLPTLSDETFEQMTEKAKGGDRVAQGRFLQTVRPVLLYYARKQSESLCFTQLARLGRSSGGVP
jgi:hypothetical protein